MGEERTHFHPNNKIRTGKVYAARPKACRSKSDIQAPTAPIMFTGWAKPETVFHERSRGW
jgi:hypothetical protein